MADEGKASLLKRFPALARLGEGSRRRRIPEIRQMMATDCGAACLAMVLGLHGREVGLDELRGLMGVGRDGMTAKGVMEAGRAMGLRGRGISIDLDRLSFLPEGAILHWSFAHFVVFEKLGEGHVQIVDPAMGRRRVSMEQFGQAFTGVALLFEPTENFQTGTRRGGGALRYLPLLLKQSDRLGRVLVMSIVVQLLLLVAPVMMGMVVDRVVPRRDYELLLVLIVSLVTVAIFQFLALVIRGNLLLELRTRLDSWMTLGFLDHLVDLPYAFFQLRPAGDLMSRMNLQSRVREILSSSALSGLLDGALVLLYFLVLFTADKVMGFIVLLLGVVQGLVFLLPQPWLRGLLAQSLEMEAKHQNYQLAILDGMQTLKAFGAERRILQGYANVFVDMANVSLAQGRLTIWVDSLTGILRLIAPLVVLGTGAYRVLDGALTLGQMLSLNALAAALLVPLSTLLGTGGQLQYLGSYLERINDVLDAPPERAPEHTGTWAQLKGAITLDHVSFRYSPSGPLVASDIALHIEPGQMVAIVGRSGAGKSTLANLLLGLYLPSSGRVLYDGRDLSELDLRAVRGQIGVVLQESFFLGTSIRANIALNEPEMTLERVVETARMAQIHDDISRMPMQYDTLLADRGASLSGGQRQRLALARALARRPAILLLDEATSSLDSISERHVHEALARLECTRIIIAHRLSTVRKADLILVMDGGKVVERGRHDELVALGGVYSELVNSQLERERATG